MEIGNFSFFINYIMCSLFYVNSDMFMHRKNKKKISKKFIQIQPC